MIKVSTLIDRLQQTFSDCDDDTALVYAQKAYDEIVSKYTLRVEAYQIPLTAGTTGYDLPETVRRIWLVEYVTSNASTDRSVLNFRVGEEMIAKGGYFTQAQGTPTDWYMWPSATKQQIAFWMTPDTTSSVTPDPLTGFYYPDVELTISQTQTLAISTELPEGTLSEDQYLAAMRLAFVTDNRKEEIQLWLSMRDREFQRLDAYMQARTDTATKIIHSGLGNRTRSVV